MSLNPGLYSTGNGEWETPPEVFAWLNGSFSFQVDAAASDTNHLCAHYWTMKEDALSFPWPALSIYVNPPYGRGMDRWVQQAHEASLAGATVVMLLPARTDTHWWHRHIEGKANEIQRLHGRVKFRLNGETNQSPPFPSVIVVYRPPQPSL